MYQGRSVSKWLENNARLFLDSRLPRDWKMIARLCRTNRAVKFQDKHVNRSLIRLPTTSMSKSVSRFPRRNATMRLSRTLLTRKSRNASKCQFRFAPRRTLIDFYLCMND